MRFASLIAGPLFYLKILLKRSLAFLNYIYSFVRSNSVLFVYSTMILNHLTSPNFLTIFYPYAVFGYALCFNPRSMPTLTDLSSLFLHPLVQNPHCKFWTVVICYSGFVICLKLAFQSHIICICDNEFSIAPVCPAMNSTGHVANGQCVSTYEELPYYNDEPMVKDVWFGLEKVGMGNTRRYVDMLFEPFPRSIIFEEVGVVNDEILDQGWGGAFLASVLGEIFVIGSILFHCEYLKMRGVWDLRVKKENNDKGGAERGEDDNGDDNERVTTKEEDSADEDKKDREDQGISIRKLPQINSERNLKKKGCFPCCGCGSCTSCKSRCSKPASRSWTIFKNLTLTTLRFLFRNSKLLVVTLYDDVLRFTNSKGRRKPGCDFYLHILMCQLIQFFFLALFMQRSDALISSIQENSISGDYVVILFMHFCIMVVDRCIYLLKSIRFKVRMN